MAAGKEPPREAYLEDQEIEEVVRRDYLDDGTG